ncbi:MAG: DUF2723 domain-containing protein [Anaerolineales bacterium]|nr:DUF2723 domain-containing protein [Anaerolineales bacterium]
MKPSPPAPPLQGRGALSEAPPPDLYLEVGLFVFGLGVYTLTLAPGLLPADAGEFQLAGATLGIAHPPGFALYTLLSRVAALWPGAGPAAALNGLSALLAALALVLLYRVVVRLTALPLAGVVAAIVLGASTTFWAQATTTNIRMPAAAATLWALDRLLAYQATLQTDNAKAQRRALAWLAFALGLGVAHHASLVFIGAVFGLYALWLRPAALRRPWPLLAGLIPFAAWLYFPLRGPAVGLPRLATLAGFWEHVLARGFGGDMLYFATASALPARLAIFANTLTFEFTLPVLALMAVGTVAGFGKDRRVGAALLAATALHVFVAITYRAPQTVEYLLPAWALMGVWAGVGAAGVARGIVAAGRRAPGRGADSLTAGAKALLLVIVLAQGAATYPSYKALAADDGPRAYAQGVLTQAPPNAVILAPWHWATPLWYLQQVEGRRSDVTVRYVLVEPGGASLADTWVSAITAALPERPVVVTSFFEGEYRATGLRFVPLGDTAAWQVLAGPLTAAPGGLQGAQTFGVWRLLGWRPSAAGPGETAVTVAWQSSGAPEAVSAYVHLLGPDGALHSQQDVAYPAERYASGEVLLDRYVLPWRPDAPAGVYTLTAGLYRPGGAPLAEAALITLTWPPPGDARLVAPPVAAPERAIPLGSALWLDGWQVTPSGPLRPGDTLRVRLHFLAARPLTADYSVKVALIGPGYAWQTASDGTPAGGALPTLKWIAGSRVTDEHVLTIPADAAAGEAQLALAVYDAFTQRPLAILDPALAAQGPTVPLGSVTVAP